MMNRDDVKSVERRITVGDYSGLEDLRLDYPEGALTLRPPVEGQSTLDVWGRQPYIADPRPELAVNKPFYMGAISLDDGERVRLEAELDDRFSSRDIEVADLRGKAKFTIYNFS